MDTKTKHGGKLYIVVPIYLKVVFYLFIVWVLMSI